MKKIISLVILLMISLISLNAQGTYSIKATINGLDTDKAKKAYLCQLVGHIMQDVDSSEIVDNKFAFKGKFGATVNSAIIKIDGVMGGIPLFIEDGDITINGNASELYMSKINGGKYSKAISEFTNKDVVMYDKAMSMLDKHHKARSNNLKDSADYYANQFQILDAEVKKFNSDFVVGNAGTPLGIYYLRAKRIARLNYDALSAEFKAYDKSEFADNNDFKMVEEQVYTLKNSEPGSKLDDITLPDKDGKIVKLSSLKGKYVLIDFWASWCGPCRKEAKHLVDVYKHYEGEKFEILAVSIDNDKSAWLKAIAEDNTPWIHLLDIKNEYKSRFGIYAIPRLMLICPDGKIISSNIRGEVLTKKLKEIFE